MRNQLFKNRTNRSQISVLRPHAVEFAQQFGLEPVSIRIANHGFNSTFKVETNRGDFALRINTHSIRSPNNLNAEIAWTSQLRDSPVTAARPHQAPNGQYILHADLSGHSRPLSAVCYEWLPGRVFPAEPTENLYKSFATLTRNLHRYAPTLGHNEELPTLVDCCHDYPFRFKTTEQRRHLSLFQNIRDLSNEVIYKLAKNNPVQVIHYDLHRLNLKRKGDEVFVLDFDDCLLGSPILDIAISFYYFRGNPKNRALEDAYWRAYGSHYSDFGLSEFDFETLIAGRRLFLLNEFVEIPLEYFQKILPQWIELSVNDFKDFLGTGKFTPSRVR